MQIVNGITCKLPLTDQRILILLKMSENDVATQLYSNYQLMSMLEAYKGNIQVYIVGRPVKKDTGLSAEQLLQEVNATINSMNSFMEKTSNDTGDDNGKRN